MEKDERPLTCWFGKYYPRKVDRGIEQAQSSDQPKDGVLLLTSRRLIYLEKKRTGAWNTKIFYQMLKENRLESIKGISGENCNSTDWHSTKNISIIDETGENKLKLNDGPVEIVKPLIEAALKMRAEEIEAEKRKDKMLIMLDFSFLKNIMEKGGLTMQVIKCPECGAPIDFPKKGNETKCCHCGKSIYAQDVFEKVKGLL